MSVCYIILFALLFFIINVFIIQILWNYVVPCVFGVRPITFLQALALYILASLLFGRFIGLEALSLFSASTPYRANFSTFTP